jgi:regulator of cell morphogenesis and NO signaling
MTLSELAIHIPGSIELFEKYNFNYYQNGKQTFKDACEEKGLSFTEIDAELDKLQRSTKANTMLTLEDMSIERLIDFINGQHHAHEEEVLNSIDTRIKKMIVEPDLEKSLLLTLLRIDIKFTDFKEKLMKHCEKEDKILFPYMRELNGARRDKTSKDISFKNPIQLLESEHIQASGILSEIKKLTSGFSIESDAPRAYQELMKSLIEFETDFHVHLHIENNILFPKVIDLEEQLKHHNRNQHDIPRK